MSKIKVVAISGSLRKDSYNHKLLNIAAGGAKTAGAEVTIVHLKDYPMPLFDEEIETKEGPPESAVKLKKLFIEADALLISSPEYNSSITAALKNAIDWISRSTKGEKPLSAFDGKVAALMSASPGGLGGLRGLVHLRSILGNLKVIVLPDQVAVGSAFEAFTDSGNLADEGKQKAILGLGQRVVDIAARLKT